MEEKFRNWPREKIESEILKLKFNINRTYWMLWVKFCGEASYKYIEQ